METLVERKTADIASFYTEHYDKCFVQAARVIAKQGGTLEDAKDIFHDALIIFYEKSLNADFILQSTEEAYIVGIVKHLWAHRIKKDLNKESFHLHMDVTDAETPFVDIPKLYNIVLTSGKKCLDLLSRFYVEKISMKEIATALGFSSEHSASVQKYKCLEKVRETIKQNSLHHEDFFE